MHQGLFLIYYQLIIGDQTAKNYNYQIRSESKMWPLKTILNLIIRDQTHIFTVTKWRVRRGFGWQFTIYNFVSSHNQISNLHLTETKWKYDVAPEDKQKEWKQMILNFMQRFSITYFAFTYFHRIYSPMNLRFHSLWVEHNSNRWFSISCKGFPSHDLTLHIY